MIKKVSKTVLIASSLLFIANCAQTSKKECLNTNWTEQGEIDGTKGIAAEEILKTQKACAKKDVEISLNDYKKGWLNGISKFCSPENAYELGLKAKEAKVENCPIELRPTYEANFKKGQSFKETNKMIAETESKIESKKNEAKELQSKIKELKNETEKLEDKKMELVKKKGIIKSEVESATSERVQYKIK